MPDTHLEDVSASDFGDPSTRIHIPARDLTGTREEKLAELDRLLLQLEVVRFALCGRVVRFEGLTAPGRRRHGPQGLGTSLAKGLPALLNVFGSRASRLRKRGRS